MADRKVSPAEKAGQNLDDDFGVGKDKPETLSGPEIAEQVPPGGIIAH
jgi:hypothetical protein